MGVGVVSNANKMRPDMGFRWKTGRMEEYYVRRDSAGSTDYSCGI